VKNVKSCLSREMMAGREYIVSCLCRERIFKHIYASAGTRISNNISRAFLTDVVIHILFTAAMRFGNCSFSL